MSQPDLSFVIDVGTGSVRCALVDDSGRIVAIRAHEHEQLVPQYGWSEQRPAEWWAGVVRAAGELLEAESGAAERLVGIVATGQMHGTVLVDTEGELVRDSVPLWNDKRTAELVTAFERDHDIDSVMRRVANPPTPAWQGFKLQWFARHEPEVLARAATLLMPKDYINYRLTGVRATDWTEASASFLMDSVTRDWSPDVAALLGVSTDILPPIRSPLDVLGQVSNDAARETGLPAGLPVVAGAADFPAALLGSGVHSAGAGSDVTGTSTIVTVHGDQPVLDSRVSNVATVDGGWGAFALLDSGGDAVRWARRAFHDNELSYEQVTRRAAEASAGSRGLFFLPYLTGERLGTQRNSRAGFFGLTAEHGLAHLHRAVLEGVAFAAAGNVGLMRRGDAELTQITAAGGGTKSDLWLRIKASAYGCPIRVPESSECSVIGSAAILAAALGRHETPAAAAEAFVHFARAVEPDPVWRERYDRMRPVFDEIYAAGGPFYDMLDGLDDTVLASDTAQGAGHA